MAVLKRKVSLRFHLNKGFDAASKSKVKEVAKSLENLMNARLEGARNYTSRLDTKIGGGPGFNQSIESYTKNFTKRLKQRFIRNPRHWPKLSNVTSIVRGYLLDPSEFVYKIMKWWNAGQKAGQIAEKPTISINRPRLDPNMKPRTPALLRTGSLMRAVKVKLGRKDVRKRVGQGWRFMHIRDIQLQMVGAPYYKTQFFGGTGVAYNLKKTFKSKDGKKVNVVVRVPNEFVTQIKLMMSDLRLAGYELESQLISIPARNPLYFDNNDISEFREILKRVSNDVKANFKGGINAK